MRREWSGWIKARQWSEFEKLAKIEPSQALADTVAELELGFPEKPDRRVLRKILFLLSQAGYEPRELEDTNPDEPHFVAPISTAFMVSPDGSGDTTFTICREEKGRVSWLIAHVSAMDGITRAIEDTTPLDEAQTRLLRLRNMAPSASLSAEVPIEIAYARLAKAIPITKNLPPVMAYWRALLPKEGLTSHPAEELPRSGAALQDIRGTIKSIPFLVYWRLELGSLTPALDRFVKGMAQHATADQLADLSWWDASLASDRVLLFDEAAIQDHRERLLDLAYVMSLRGMPESSNVMAIADDLTQLGPESEYAKWMATKTFLLLFETIRRQGAKERSEGSAGR